MTERPAKAHSHRWRRWLAVAAVCTIAVYIPYSVQFELRTNLPDALYGAGLAAVVLAAAAARWKLGFGFWSAFAAGAVGAPAAVMLQVVRDVIRDPTAHNLWPFELAIALGVSIPAALGGASIGWLLAKATRSA